MIDHRPDHATCNLGKIRYSPQVFSLW